MIAFYYLLRVGEYTVKGTGQQDSGATQTQQFKMKDVTFFGTNSRGGVVQIIAKCLPQPLARHALWPMA